MPHLRVSTLAAVGQAGMGGNLAYINRLVRVTSRSTDFMDYTHEGARLLVNLAHEVCLLARIHWLGGERGTLGLD